jgi:hypothetical protein
MKIEHFTILVAVHPNGRSATFFVGKDKNNEAKETL